MSASLITHAIRLGFPFVPSRIWLLLFNPVWIGRQPGNHFLVLQGFVIPSQHALNEHFMHIVPAESVWATGVEGTYPSPSAPAGETGLSHTAKRPWANHFTSPSSKHPFVKRGEIAYYGLGSFYRASSVRGRATDHSFTNAMTTTTTSRCRGLALKAQMGQRSGVGPSISEASTEDSPSQGTITGYFIQPSQWPSEEQTIIPSDATQVQRGK